MIRQLIRLASVAIVASLAWASPAFAQIQAVNLQPLDDWVMERLADRCVFRRSFGDPSSPTTLELGSIDPWSGGFQTAITTARYAFSGEPFRAGWLPGGRIADVDLITSNGDREGRRRIVFPHGLWDGAVESRVVGSEGPFDVLEIGSDYDFDNAPSRFRGSIQGLLVLGAFDEPLFLSTGSMQEIFEARESCMDEVLRSHGVDPLDADRDEHRVEMINRQSMTQRILRRIPAEARRRERPTMISFLLYVDEEGGPRSCRMTSLPYNADYERRSCETLMNRAEFEFREGETAQPTFYIVSGFWMR